MQGGFLPVYIKVFFFISTLYCSHKYEVAFRPTKLNYLVPGMKVLIGVNGNGYLSFTMFIFSVVVGVYLIVHVIFQVDPRHSLLICKMVCIR